MKFPQLKRCLSNSTARSSAMAEAANSALLTDTYTSPLRAQRGAAKRER
jgi:hypothetical protein